MTNYKKSPSVTVPWSYGDGDYAVTCVVHPGSKGSYGQPPEYPELEVVSIEVDGEGGTITDDMYALASEDSKVYDAAMEALSE